MNPVLLKALKYLVILHLGITVAACGGGGSSPSQQTPQPPVAQTGEPPPGTQVPIPMPDPVAETVPADSSGTEAKMIEDLHLGNTFEVPQSVRKYIAEIPSAKVRAAATQYAVVELAKQTLGTDQEKARAFVQGPLLKSMTCLFNADPENFRTIEAEVKGALIDADPTNTTQEAFSDTLENMAGDDLSGDDAAMPCIVNPSTLAN